MVAKLVYVSPDYAKQYTAKTGKTVSSNLVSSEDFARMDSELYGGGAKAPSSPSAATPAGSPKTGVVDQSDPLGIRQAVGNAVSQYGGSRSSSSGSSSTPGVSSGLQGTLDTVKQRIGAGDLQAAAQYLSQQTGISLEQALANVQTYQGLPRGQAPGASPGATGVTPSGQPPVAPPATPPNFAEFLASLGVTMPTVPQFSFDPQEGVRAAAAQAELAIKPQREMIRLEADQRLAQQRAKGEADLTKLRESQAQRRMFGSPVGLFTEQEQVRANDTALRSIEDMRDQRVAGLEMDKANRTQTGLRDAERLAFDQWSRGADVGLRQFGSVSDLVRMFLNQGNEDRRYGLERGKALGYVRDSQTGQRVPTLEAAKADRQYQLELGKALGYVTDPGTGGVVPTAQAAQWARDNAVDMARLMGYMEMPDGTLVRTTDGKRFDLQAAETLSKQTGYIVGLDGEPLLDEQGKPVPTLERAKFDWDQDKFTISQADKNYWEEQAHNLRAQGLFNQAQHNAVMAEIRRGELSLATARLIETQRHNQAVEDETGRHNQANEGIARDRVQLEQKSPQSNSWKGMMGDLKSLEQSQLYGQMKPGQMPAAVQALLQKWVPSMADDEAGALESYLQARGYLK